jgi:hypothetical protein
MEFFSPLHLSLILAIAAVMVWPLGRILRRAGFNPAWCLVAFFPIVNWIALWVFAYLEWPALDNHASGILKDEP